MGTVPEIRRRAVPARARVRRDLERPRSAGPALLLVAPFALGLLATLGRPAESAAPDSAPVPLRIDVNTADWPELMLLPGVGEMRARDIVRFRERRGAFRDVEDLDQVPGIGERSLERIRPFASVDRDR
jgi:competence protein ComEA